MLKLDYYYKYIVINTGVNRPLSQSQCNQNFKTALKKSLKLFGPIFISQYCMAMSHTCLLMTRKNCKNCQKIAFSPRMLTLPTRHYTTSHFILHHYPKRIHLITDDKLLQTQFLTVLLGFYIPFGHFVFA